MGYGTSPGPYRIRGIVENDIRIYPYMQKFTDIRKYLSAVPYTHTSTGLPHDNGTGPDLSHSSFYF